MFAGGSIQDVEKLEPKERLELAPWLPDAFRDALPETEAELLRRVEGWLGTAGPQTPTALQTPFAGLHVPKVEGASASEALVPPPPAYWPAALHGMPTPTKPDVSRALANWQQAAKHLALPAHLSPRRRYGLLYGLAQKHLAPLAAHAPDVPQAVQRQLLSAHAACLWQAREQAEPDAGFALLVTDLSGIQDYLFGTAKFGVGRVARSVRARSFYLSQIAALFAWSLLARLELPPSCLLLDSGGKFYLLFAPTQSALAQVKEAQCEAAAWTLNTLHGELTLNVAFTRYGPEALQAGHFGKVWQAANRAVAEEKQRRMHSVLLDEAGGWNESAFLRDTDFKGEQPCEACKRFPPLFGEKKCAACHRDEELGKRLPDVGWIAYEKGDAEKPEDIAAFGWRVRIGTSKDALPDTADWILALDPKFSDQHGLPYRALARHIPVKPNTREPLDFSEMAGQAKGRPYLAYLKADVDRLGERFVFGLRDANGATRDSLPRLVHLSRALETFFGGELECIVRADFRACYIVFSGGDDLTIIGPYDQILRLSRRLVREFRRFLGYTDGEPPPSTDVLTLSAGIVLASPRLPVSVAVPRAETALDEAKDGGRNRIHLLGRTLTWDYYDRVLSRLWDERGEPAPGFGMEILQGVSSGFLYHLLRYARMWEGYREWEKAGNDPKKHDELKRRGYQNGLRYQPMLAYDIGRNVDPRKTPEIHRWASKLIAIQLTDEWKTEMDNLGLLTRLALLYRSGGE